MPKAAVSIRECNINTQGQAVIVYNFASDYIPQAGSSPLSIGDQTMTVNLASSVVQTNNGIRNGVIDMLVSQGFPSSGITAGDVTVFGGAQ